MIMPRLLVAALLVMIAATGAAAEGAETALHTELVSIVMIAVILAAGFLARISPPERTGAPRITDSRQINHP